MTDKNNAEVMAWFQQQQTPAGWFDLLLIMIDGMLNNAGELESQPFLRQMGKPWPIATRCRSQKPSASWRSTSTSCSAAFSGGSSAWMWAMTVCVYVIARCR
jgi:hypothetical protein